jgi:hypothetical protein
VNWSANLTLLTLWKRFVPEVNDVNDKLGVVCAPATALTSNSNQKYFFTQLPLIDQSNHEQRAARYCLEKGENFIKWAKGAASKPLPYCHRRGVGPQSGAQIPADVVGRTGGPSA